MARRSGQHTSSRRTCILDADHPKRICSTIEELPPDINFDVSKKSELPFTEASGLSQELGSLLSEVSNVLPASQSSQDGIELAPIIPHTEPQTHLSLKENIKQDSNGQRGSILRNIQTKRCRALDKGKRPGIEDEITLHSLQPATRYDLSIETDSSLGGGS